MTADFSRFRFTLVAVLLVALAILAHTQAEETAADLGGVAAGVSQTNGPTDHAKPGDILTYRYTVLGTSSGTTAGTRLIGTVDGGVPNAETGANATIISVTGVSGVWSTGECVIEELASAREFTCTDATGPLTGNSTVDVMLRVEPATGNDLRLYPPNCLVEDNGTGEVTCDNSAIPLQTVDLGAPPNATTTVGTTHVFTFGLADGVTCQSDTLDNDGLRSCADTDVIIANSGGANCEIRSGPTVGSTNLNANSIVSVTINGTLPGVCDVLIAEKLDPRTCASNCTGATFISIADPVTTLTYLQDADRDGFADAADNCPTEYNLDQADGDSDGTGNECDNCASIANAGQANGDADRFGDVCEAAHCTGVPNWWVSPGAATDPDCDSYPTDWETRLGTDPNDSCANTSEANDEPDDKTPADFNDNRFFNTVDLVVYAAALNTFTGHPNYQPRADITGNGQINTLDLVIYAGALGHACGP